VVAADLITWKQTRVNWNRDWHLGNYASETQTDEVQKMALTRMPLGPFVVSSVTDFATKLGAIVGLTVSVAGAIGHT